MGRWDTGIGVWGDAVTGKGEEEKAGKPESRKVCERVCEEARRGAGKGAWREYDKSPFLQFLLCVLCASVVQFYIANLETGG